MRHDSDEDGDDEVGDAREVMDELRAPTREPRTAAPHARAGFARLHDAAIADGVLSRRVKELMTLVIAVVRRCGGWITVHAKTVAVRGATPGEAAETLSVALLMDGGAGTVCRPRAWAAYQELVPSQPA